MSHEMLPVKMGAIAVNEEKQGYRNGGAYTGPRTDGTKNTQTRVRVRINRSRSQHCV